MDLRYIGKNIRFYRTEQRASQEKLAERTGLSPNYIGMIERGERLPSLTTVISIAEALNVQPGILFIDWEHSRWKWVGYGCNE